MDLQGGTLEALDRLCVRGRARGVHITSTSTLTPPGHQTNQQTTVYLNPAQALQPMSEADGLDVETLARSGRAAGICVVYLSRLADADPGNGHGVGQTGVTHEMWN